MIILHFSLPAKIIVDHHTGHSRGFGFVAYGTEAETATAYEHAHHTVSTLL